MLEGQSPVQISQALHLLLSSQRQLTICGIVNQCLELGNESNLSSTCTPADKVLALNRTHQTVSESVLSTCYRSLVPALRTMAALETAWPVLRPPWCKPVQREASGTLLLFLEYDKVHPFSPKKFFFLTNIFISKYI